MTTMNALLDLCAQAHPDRLALTLGDAQATFGQVDAAVGRYASALLGLGVQRGDVVLGCCGTSFDHVYLHFALSRIGAVFAPADPQCSPDDLNALAAYVGAVLIVADGPRQEKGQAVAYGAGIPFATIGPVEGTRAGPDLMDGGDQTGPCQGPDPDDLHALYFTSGSTGRPKAVAITHRVNWLRAYLAANITSAGGMVCMFPLFHMAGWQVIAQSWARRRAVHLVQRADAESLLGAVERWRASTLYAIPAVWRRILDCRKTFDLSSLRAVDAGTSYVGPDLIMELRDRFPGTHNIVSYGSTEMGAALQIAHEDILRKPGSVGLPGPAVEARIVDGELQLRGPTMMQGYYRLPEETAAAIVDGWYHSGDLAERDADGFYSITGRRREIIRSGGETLSPIELDAMLKAHITDVVDIAVIGLPHPEWGEILCAAIVAGDTATPTLEDIRARLSGISSAKQPRAIRQVPFIPRTPATGQVKRSQLKEMVLAQRDHM